MNALGDADAWSEMEGFYVAGFVIAGVFISGMAFTNLRSKEKTMTYLSLPASTVEKLIVSADNLFSASSKEMRVRVEDS